MKTKSKASPLVRFVKTQRKALGITQRELADKAGVGLRFVRDLEQGRTGLRLNKLDELLRVFGARLEPVKYNDGDAA